MSRFNICSSDEPHLVWVIEPETRIRFRYESEGGSHGGLSGKDGKKTYPTLELRNYNGTEQVFVKVSLYTEDYKEHVLEFKGKKNDGNKACIEEPLQDDNRVVFKNLQILSKKKDLVEQILMERKLKNLRECGSYAAKVHLQKNYSKEVKDRARNILNTVRLCFEAFEVNRPDVPLCKLFSDVICNLKAAAKGDLRICRLSQFAGSWKGGDEIILLCEKVQKENIKVKFYETNEKNEIIWHNYGIFSPPDVHYQVAITFKTPRYKSNEEKRVFICLERDGEMSEPREFTYKPDEEQPSSKKRKLENHESTVILTPDTPDSVGTVPFPYAASPYSFLNGESGEMQGMSNFQSDDSNQVDMDENLDELLKLCGNIDDDTLNFPLPFEHLLGTINDVADGSSVPDIGINEGEISNLRPYFHEVNQSLTLIDIGLEELSLEEENENNSDCLKKSVEKEPELSKNSFFDQHKKNICYSLLSKKNIYSNTLLHVAVLSNKNIVPILKMSHLLKINLINVQNQKKQTALHIAVEKNKCEEVKILLKCGGNPNLKDCDGNNCYHIATKNNSPSVLKTITTFSLFPHKMNDFNYEGLTPLHIAALQRNPNLFYFLKDHVTDVNVMEKKGGKSLLHYAVDFQSSILPELLKMTGIDVNIQDFDGNTPLHIACANDNIDAVIKLLYAGADPSIKNYKLNFNCLDLENSMEYCYGQLPKELTTNVEILKLLSVKPKENEKFHSLQNYENFQVSDETSQITEKLCRYLEKDMKWKTLAPFFLDEDVIESLNLSSSPAKTLLDYVKKEQQENYLESLKRALEFAMLKDCVEIINENIK